MTIEQQEEQENIKTQDLLNELNQDVKVASAATESFIDEFQFNGRSLREHSEALWIEIPKNPNPEDFRLIFTKLARNIQIATHYYSVASSINSALYGSSKQRKADIIKTLAEAYEKNKKRRPSHDTLDKMADSYMQNTANVATASRIVKDFWKQKIESLIEVRKCMEAFGMSKATELKYLDHST